MTVRPIRWRIFLIVSGLLIIIGGPMHPGGTMEQMLANSRWIPAHSLLVLAFVSFFAALALFQSGPPATRRWTRLALIGTALQVIEMVAHTLAAFDHANLVAGHATPILKTHLTLSLFCYPIFASTVIGLIIAGAHDRVLGSWWIAWLGILGALGHGLAAPLVVGLNIASARALFPMLLLLAIWMICAALCHRRSPEQVLVQPN